MPIAFRISSVVAVVLLSLKTAGAPGLEEWSLAAIIGSSLALGAAYTALGTVLVWAERRCC